MTSFRFSSEDGRRIEDHHDSAGDDPRFSVHVEDDARAAQAAARLGMSVDNLRAIARGEIPAPTPENTMAPDGRLLADPTRVRNFLVQDAEAHRLFGPALSTCLPGWYRVDDMCVPECSADFDMFCTESGPARPVTEAEREQVRQEAYNAWRNHLFDVDMLRAIDATDRYPDGSFARELIDLQDAIDKTYIGVALQLQKTARAFVGVLKAAARESVKRVLTRA